MPERRRMHPLAGGLATVGGLVCGLGIGLAMREPAAGLLAGWGLGMILTAFLRAYGSRPPGDSAAGVTEG